MRALAYYKREIRIQRRLLSHLQMSSSFIFIDYKSRHLLTGKSLPWRHTVKNYLPSVGIMEALLKAPINSLDTRHIALWCLVGFRGCPQLGGCPWLPRDAGLSDSCTSDHCSFPCLTCLTRTWFATTFKLNGISSFWQFFFCFGTKLNPFGSETVKKSI